MVRIIPVHNFLCEKKTEEIEEATASCVANIMDQDMLLLGMTSHCVKVYGLAMNNTKLLTVFPSVDLVNEIIHSDKGNYVATVECKISRDGITINNFVRVYVNWELCSNQNQAMRARIAGRVTPSLNRSLNTLEMIELPINGLPNKITCCQTTGNLLVLIGQEAIIHELKIEKHQTTKHKFIDFEMRPWSIKFSFIPKSIDISEEFISVKNNKYFMLIKITNVFIDDVNQNNIYNNINNINNVVVVVDAAGDVNKNDLQSKLKCKNNTSSIKQLNIDFSKIITNELSYINWENLITNEIDEIQRIEKLNIIDIDKSKNTTILLPTVQSNRGQQFDSITNAPHINAVITTKSNQDSWSENYTIHHLLRLQININNEIFTCSLLKPMYKRQQLLNNYFKKSLLRSNKYNIFHGVTCLICTTQEGYLYHFSPTNNQELSTNTNCYQIYTFTAPVCHVALENTALHAFTEAGLESYTLRIPFYNDDNFNNPVSLIGLRPFLSVKQLLHAAKCLILIANDKDYWNFYSLYLPNPEDVYQDILNAANNHKTTSLSSYKHLLSEANSVLKFSKDFIYYTSDAEFTNNIDNVSKSHIDYLYKQSCQLLADYYISSDDYTNWNISNYYYEIAGLKAHDILKRKNIKNAPGLFTYLSEYLLNLQVGSESDILFQEHNIVEILMTADKNDLFKLILASPILREYATDKLIHLVTTFPVDDLSLMTLVLLYLQADRQKKAEKSLEMISNDFLYNKILINWSWLFDITNFKKENMIPTFSDFSAILMKLKINIFTTVLSKIIESKALTLNQTIQIFLNYLPSRVGRDGRIAAISLQLTLEVYFKSLYDKSKNIDVDFGILEGFKILVRSYLGELTQTNYNKTNNQFNYDDILFYNLRPKYLDHPLLYSKDKKLIKLVTGSSDGIDRDIDNNKSIDIRLEVRKLQALLASGYLPGECYQEVQNFLQTHTIQGQLSFIILCTQNTEKEMQILVNECPQVLLQFAKDKYTKETEWKGFVQFLFTKLNESADNTAIYDELMKDTCIHIAQTMTMQKLQRILPSDNLPCLQQYIDISNQIVHADYIKTMIIGTGQHLLSNINF